MSQSKEINLIIEHEVLPELHEKLKSSALKAGVNVRNWNEDWQFEWPAFSNKFTIFHGSLGTSNLIKNNASWSPGVYCNINKFFCSNWYPKVSNYLVHKKWITTTVQEFVNQKEKYFEQFGSNEIFVRPDSPLKPFAGRVINKEKVSLKSLDHGFYYEELDLPIILAPIRVIGNEWRFVIQGKSVITGSGYIANNRSGTVEITEGPQWDLANEIANQIEPIDPIYIIDIAETDNELSLMEFNPFSGADLYSCNTDKIIASLIKIAHSV